MTGATLLAVVIATTAGRARLAAAVRAAGRRPLITVSTLIAVVVASGLAQTDLGFRLLGGIGLAASSEPYTELYFVSPSAAGATRTVIGRGAEDVSFVIRNREATGKNYEWTIRTSTGAGTLHGAVWVPQNGSALVTRELDLVCGGRDQPAAAQQVQVRVSIAHPSESIDYWTGCSA